MFDFLDVGDDQGEIVRLGLGNHCGDEMRWCKDPNIAYNDLASWNYAEIPHALGCDDWYTARVTTCGELDSAMTVAAQADTGVYIEVVTDTYAASQLVMQLHDNLASLYNT